MTLKAPQRGDQARMIRQAARNAEEELDRRLAETSTQARNLREIAETFELAEPPQRIEVYDNSHVMGTNAVGAMIVAGPEGFRKNQYRKFNIKRPETAPGDDFAMMREVLGRRFARLEKEDPDRSKGDWPDLLLIDGGKGQLSAVCEVLEDAGVHDVPVVAVSKGPDRNAGRETFHLPGGREIDLAAQFAFALLPPAAARRGPPLRDRRPPGEARQELHRQPARRGPRHRPGPQARLADAFRHRARGAQRRARGYREGARHLAARRRAASTIISTRGDERACLPSAIVPASFVIPAKAGIQLLPTCPKLDSRFRGNDGKGRWRVRIDTPAIIVAVRPHGEHGAIVRALTPATGSSPAMSAAASRGGCGRCSSPATSSRPIIAPAPTSSSPISRSS